MANQNQPPFRMPCEGVSDKPLYFFGATFQHGGSVLVDKYTNTTTVPNWDTPPPDNIAAYERWTQDFSGGGSCEVHYCVGGGAPCSAWLRPLPDNTWHHTSGEKVDFTVTRMRGFKNVQAKRCWNGRTGYLDKTGNIDTVSPCSDPSTAKFYLAYQSTPVRTRYLTIAGSATWNKKGILYSDGSTASDVTKTATVAESIGATTGILNPTSVSASPNDETSEAVAALAKAFWHWSDFISLFLAVTFSGDSTVWTADGVTSSDTGSGFTLEEITWDLSAGTFTRNRYGFVPTLGSPTWGIIFTETATVADDSFEYSSHYIYTVPDYPPQHGQTDITVTGTLSDPVTDDDIYADLITLLDEWNLADHQQYPWRTDNKVGVAPLVSRDEIATSDFDALTYAVKDYDAPVTDFFGGMFGDPDWAGDTGIMVSPNPQTGTYRTAVPFVGHNSGAVIDQQITGFAHTDAAITCTVIAGSFPPGVSMDSAGHITGTVGDDGRYGVTIEVTCGVVAATGEIRGSPKEAGFENFWDFLFTDVRGCCFRPEDNPGAVTWAWYQVGWGQDVVTFNANTGCHLPLNSTQWNNWIQAVSKPAGAWIFYSDHRQDYFPADCAPSFGGSGSGDAAQIVAQKWAEVPELWPSQNFSKPAGDMKFWFDENRVYCATNVAGSGAGSVWSLIDPTTGLPPATTPEVDDYWGGPCVDGFYLLSAWDGTNVTLGAKQFDVPNNWVSKSDVGAIDLGDGAMTDADSCFGALRWPTFPALLGRAAVTTSGPGTSFAFAAAQPAFGMNSSTHQEQVDLYDASMNAVAINATATRVDDSHFTIASGQPSAVWVQIHGSPAWYMNDESSKGDFAVLEWLADLRSFGEYARLSAVTDCNGTPVTGLPTTNAGGGPISEETQFASFTQTPGCLPFVPCSPKVICISPNGETFANGITHEFPAMFVCDYEYGSKWWGYVQQTMTDLFWQRPHRPCNIDTCGRWLMDDGACQENVGGTCPSPAPEYFYEHAPQVETRLTIPANYGATQDESAPALPTGIQIGWLSPVNHTPADGDVAYPPEFPGVSSSTGAPGGAKTPWGLHEALCATIGGGCRFNYNVSGC